MNNEQTPDYGEPWRATYVSRIEDRDDYWQADTRCNDRRDRIIACINACAGMADPAAEIAAMREAIRQAHTALEGCLKYMLSVSVCNLDLEYETMDDAHLALAKLQPFITP